MKSLVIGMGIGQLYKSVLKELGHDVVTVDSNPSSGAEYYDYTAAYIDHEHFDTVHICTPNYTHLNIARNTAGLDAKIVFVEKPGVENHTLWKTMVEDFPDTRFMMVKNNQYRDEIEKFKGLAQQSSRVKITWNNRNRIPKPGSWFTTKELAFGGVSRDLIPHMLSYYCALTNYKSSKKLFALAEQRWDLSNIDSTDYGTVDSTGTYDVDDFCELEYKNNNCKYILSANWRSLKESDISISFDLPSSAVRYELGLCPESAYKKMIGLAVQNLNNDNYWAEQLAQDIWIHEQIERL